MRYTAVILANQSGKDVLRSATVACISPKPQPQPWLSPTPPPPLAYLTQNIATWAEVIHQFIIKIDKALDDGQGSAVVKGCEALDYQGLLAKPGSTEDIIAILPSDNTHLWMKEVEMKLCLNGEVLDKLDSALDRMGRTGEKTFISR